VIFLSQNFAILQKKKRFSKENILSQILFLTKKNILQKKKDFFGKICPK